MTAFQGGRRLRKSEFIIYQTTKIEYSSSRLCFVRMIYSLSFYEVDRYLWIKQVKKVSVMIEGKNGRKI